MLEGGEAYKSLSQRVSKPGCAAGALGLPHVAEAHTNPTVQAVKPSDAREGEGELRHSGPGAFANYSKHKIVRQWNSPCLNRLGAMWYIYTKNISEILDEVCLKPVAL